jgi:hypothetical protein
MEKFWHHYTVRANCVAFCLKPRRGCSMIRFRARDGYIGPAMPVLRFIDPCLASPADRYQAVLTGRTRSSKTATG